MIIAVYDTDLLQELQKKSVAKLSSIEQEIASIREKIREVDLELIMYNIILHDP